MHLVSFLDGLRHRWNVWRRPAQYERALDDEMRFHLALDSANGSDPHPDLDGARRRFGNPTYLREETRHMAGLATFDGLTQDARHMVRSLRRAPGFALVTTLTLALGIGITTAVVSVVDHVLIHALPLRDAGQVMALLERQEHAPTATGFRTPSAPTVADGRRDAGVRQAFEDVAFVRGEGAVLRLGESNERTAVGFVGPEFFPVLGARPLLGRALIADDFKSDAAPVAVIQHWLWQRKLGGDPHIVGRKIEIDSVPYTVVGVMPPGVAYPNFAFAWIPLSQYHHMDILTRRGLHADSRTIGRLRAGVDSARAVALMKTASAQLAAAYPVEQGGWTPALLPVRDEVVGDVKPMLLTVVGAAAAVLLLVCANVSNLLLARTAARTRELAVRSALGASRGRVVRQLLTESFVLAGVGGILGGAVASLAIAATRKWNQLPRSDELVLDHRVLIVAVGACVLTALLCGVWPALRATRSSSGETLRAGALGSVGVRGESRARRVLVTIQFAFALTLLTGAGLLLQSFRRATKVDVGFDPQGLVDVSLNPPRTYAADRDAAALYTRLMAATRAVPGVLNTAFINHTPFSGGSILTPVELDGSAPADTASRQVFYRTVSAGYLDTMKMRMSAGRWFTSDDERSPGGSFVINATMAKQYWPGENAVGKRLTIRRSSQVRADFGQPLPGVVVGVVSDVHQTAQDAAPDPEIYVPYTLETWPWGHLVVRTRDGARSIPALRAAIESIDPGLVERGARGNERFATFDEAIANRLAPRKTSMSFVGGFAVCALVLAAIGMYGVVSYGVTQRTRELGVRKALGATDSVIAMLLMRESLWLTAGGIVLGSAGAWLSTRFIKTLLFETSAFDAGVYAATAMLLVIIALIATYVPMRRATRLDPTIAMRGE